MNLLRWFRERKLKKAADKTGTVSQWSLSVCAINPNVERQGDLIEVCQNVLSDPDDSGRLALLVMQLPLLGVLSRSEEHTSELQSLMRISYAVFCLKKQKSKNTTK